MTRRSGGGLGGLTARRRECTVRVLTAPKPMRAAPGPRAVPVMVDGGGVGDDAPVGVRGEVVP